MTKHKRDNVPALVLAVVTRVYEVAQGWTQPWYVDRTRLSLSDDDAERDPGHYIDLRNTAMSWACRRSASFR